MAYVFPFVSLEVISADYFVCACAAVQDFLRARLRVCDQSIVF